MDKQMRKIILGGHWCELEGWEIYTEEQIDITKPLPFDDGSIDFIFTEHVIEHVYFHQGVSFLREANRVLKSGGKIRTVCPFIDVIISTDLDNDNGKEYIKTQILPICFGKQYKDALDDIGIQYEKHAQVFSLLNQYHCFSHKFMWTTSLMKDVMSNIGFQDVTRRDPRCGDNTSLCVGSLPHRQLRKSGLKNSPMLGRSLPHRQLRNDYSNGVKIMRNI